MGEVVAEIHEELSELLDKQVNVQKESLKKLSGFTQAREKVMKERKNDCCVKIFVVKGRTL